MKKSAKSRPAAPARPAALVTNSAAAFSYAPAGFIPFRDLKVVERIRRIRREDIAKHRNPDYRITVIPDSELEMLWISVSQIEEQGFGNFWSFSQPLLQALEELRSHENLRFACLLVTDIGTRNSLLLYRGDPDVAARISYRAVETGEIFDLPGIVSRKMQLLPFLGSLLDA